MGKRSTGDRQFDTTANLNNVAEGVLPKKGENSAPLCIGRIEFEDRGGESFTRENAVADEVLGFCRGSKEPPNIKWQEKKERLFRRKFLPPLIPSSAFGRVLAPNPSEGDQG